ncbi:S8 family serine peptidase [Polaribacter haliotis]|uniref:S8 family serine peptidase n=1 Tax=Polaribacter haliotis TaxID=1888915 RepID=A0A7L8AG46_9FLAO|nr:S8 family serine peptidase [Polaribacter haliotis]QOD60986.1 S8 family serine peptidase [Polaribacter haliotis]
MNKKILKLYFCFITIIGSNLIYSQNSHKSDLWAFDILNIPENKTKGKDLTQITIAVIDDGFMLSHKSIASFLYKNTSEVENNFIDDDGNGYIDDFIGWDIADDDSNVNIPEGKEANYYHGTYVASLITRIASIHYGALAKDYIKIMPIKVLEDNANNTYLKKGYDGVKYAIDNGADIICLSWSGGFPTEKQKTLMKQAKAKGIIIVSSAGNFNERKVLYPANFKEVIAVAGVGVDLEKGKFSNFGDKISISAPSEYVKGAYPVQKNAYIHDNGTSASAGLVAGVIALLKSKNPSLNKEEVEAIINNSSNSNSTEKNKYLGLLGSGIIDVEKAILSLNEPNKFFSSNKNRGAILYNKRNSDSIYTIKPEGVFSGFNLSLSSKEVKKKKNNYFSIYLKDTLWRNFNLENIPKKLYIPANSFTVKTKAKFKKKDIFKMSFYSKSIDSTKLYCKEITNLSKNGEVVNNGSLENNYVNNTSCRWVITAPKNKRIKFLFNKMDTEPNVDFVYIADGESLVQENIFAKFSGNNLPPVVSSNSNKVLVWFITDKKNTKKGWEFKYEFVD